MTNGFGTNPVTISPPTGHFFSTEHGTWIGTNPMKDIQSTLVFQPPRHPHLAALFNFSRAQLLPTIRRQRVSADNSLNN
jgi:hypothetical protein